MVTSGINGGDGGAGGEVLQDNGLYAGHEYSLLKLEMVKTNDGRMVQLLNIRNPWGQGEFNGDWSDSSDKWDMVARKFNFVKILSKTHLIFQLSEENSYLYSVKTARSGCVTRTGSICSHHSMFVSSQPNSVSVKTDQYSPTSAVFAATSR